MLNLERLSPPSGALPFVHNYSHDLRHGLQSVAPFRGFFKQVRRFVLHLSLPAQALCESAYDAGGDSRIPVERGAEGVAV